MHHILEWLDLIAAFFLYIPSLLGVIFGVALTLGIIARSTLRKSVFLFVALVCVYLFIQVNSAFSQILLEMLLDMNTNASNATLI